MFIIQTRRVERGVPSTCYGPTARRFRPCRGESESLKCDAHNTTEPIMSDLRSTNTYKISIMMFLQFFTWGAWFATLGLCLGSNGLLGFAGGAYGSAPLGAMIAPLFLGLIADRFFPSRMIGVPG